ncbi:polysaccharide deacetylase [Mycobacterium sp. MS1601]|uniref:polysaccharide deacetylase family protein n=1 Tax=Mycobacterium sp. MS1601 TaxID=1936029 RepID=UPI0009794C43|nr:polysaccharide deacetylase [Mycobacterium sp. MS1601]AQA03766.1 polysaccharide deacetylase [Mycobacterium sp. MS1601]
MKKIQVCVGVDVDSVAGWIGSYGGEDSPADIQRGVFAAEVGIPRMLRLLERHSVPATFFIPGHSIESFPREMQMVADAGHEIGAHGYTHENPTSLSLEQERVILEKSIELIDRLCGRPPVGYVAPWLELSENTIDLLVRNGFSYDHTQQFDDFTPFYARSGDSWTAIDYDQAAESWMRPYVSGAPVDLVVLPPNWYLSDFTPMVFIKKMSNSHGWVSPRSIEQDWRDQFDWIYREMDYAVFSLNTHPDASGRPQIAAMLERFIQYVARHPGVEFVTMEAAAAQYRRRVPFDSVAPSRTERNQ